MKLSIQKKDDDWFVLVNKNTFERPCDVSVEGTREEWEQVAKAIESGREASFKRCAVYKNGSEYSFWSPRNSFDVSDFYSASVEEALELVTEINKIIL